VASDAPASITAVAVSTRFVKGLVIVATGAP
jgi:hypothetical protein